MRLIDADALDLEREVEMADDWKTAHEIANVVKYAPTVDAAPVKHGRWTTKRTKEHDGEWYCSACGYEPIVMSDDMIYCPGCGAKMIMETQNDEDGTEVEHGD